MTVSPFKTGAEPALQTSCVGYDAERGPRVA